MNLMVVAIAAAAGFILGGVVAYFIPQAPVWAGLLAGLAIGAFAGLVIGK